MNLVGTLGKMILSNAMGRGGGNVLGSLLGGGQGGAGGLGGLLGGAQQGGEGGLGGLLGGAQQGGAQGGGLGGLLGGAQQGGAQAGGAGGLGGMLGQILGGAQQGGAQQGGAGGLGGLLGQALGGAQAGGQAQPQPQQADNDQAALMIRAMLNAAKSDGEFDQEEQQNIVGKLGGDVGPEEAQFIRDEVSQPLDVQGFIRSVPRGMEKQVYLVSLMAINLDSKAEADYLDQLAKGLNISEPESNQLHAEIGVPQLYT